MWCVLHCNIHSNICVLYILSHIVITMYFIIIYIVTSMYCIVSCLCIILPFIHCYDWVFCFNILLWLLIVDILPHIYFHDCASVYLSMYSIVTYIFMTVYCIVKHIVLYIILYTVVCVVLQYGILWLLIALYHTHCNDCVFVYYIL